MNWPFHTTPQRYFSFNLLLLATPYLTVRNGKFSFLQVAQTREMQVSQKTEELRIQIPVNFY